MDVLKAALVLIGFTLLMVGVTAQMEPGEFPPTPHVPLDGSGTPPGGTLDVRIRNLSKLGPTLMDRCLIEANSTYLDL